MSFFKTEVYTCDWCGTTRNADHSSTDCYYTGEPFPDDWYRVNGIHLCCSCGRRRLDALDNAEAQARAACAADTKGTT